MEELPWHPFGDISVIRKFPSKKNHVYLVDVEGKRMILKLFTNDRCANEFRVLSQAYDIGIPVPRPYEMRDRAILMEYVVGKTVNDLVETGHRYDLVLGVASWLARFHRTFIDDDGKVLLKSDAIFKNFIVADRIYGIDFELSRPGNPEEDVGEAISFLLDTNPMFTDEKIRLAYSFIRTYEGESGIKLNDIEDSIAKSLIEAAGFRPGQRELLLKKAKDLIVLKPFSR
ncbi:phosphotransferase [Methanocella sp. MCL-LM]|uniref:phosphotransferase n=1 Tax=Methanocella sp. MCL-LM TaxID=3412035 RepID=UPI003C71477B